MKIDAVQSQERITIYFLASVTTKDNEESAACGGETRLGITMSRDIAVELVSRLMHHLEPSLGEGVTDG